MPMLLELLARGTVLSALVLILDIMPVTRRYIASGTLIAVTLIWLVLLPLANLVVPRIGITVLPARLAAPFLSTVNPTASGQPKRSELESGRESALSTAEVSQTDSHGIVRTARTLEDAIVPLYAAMALAIVLSGAAARRAAMRLVRHADLPVPQRIAEHARVAAAQLGLRRTPPLAFTLDASLPCVVGAWRPVVLMPAGAEQWSDERLRAVLVHEMAHVRRHDTTMGVVREIATAINWVNPLVWILAARHRREAELACDRAVVASGVDAHAYACDLLQLARRFNGSSALASALGVAGASALRRRIEEIMSDPPSGGARRLAITVLLACVLALPSVLVVPVAEARQQRGLASLNMSNGGLDVSSNDAGLQARWNDRGVHSALFVTGPVDFSAAASGTVGGSGHVLLVDERDGVHVFEWNPTLSGTLPATVRESITIGARLLSRLAGKHDRRFPGSSLSGLPAWSDDPTAHVVQAGWLDGSSRFGLAMRGHWSSSSRGIETRDARAWFVLFAYDERTRHSRRVQVVPDATGRLITTMFIDGAVVPYDEASLRWAVESFVVLKRNAPADFEWGTGS